MSSAVRVGLFIFNEYFICILFSLKDNLDRLFDEEFNNKGLKKKFEKQKTNEKANHNFYLYSSFVFFVLSWPWDFEKEDNCGARHVFIFFFLYSSSQFLKTFPRRTFFKEILRRNPNKWFLVSLLYNINSTNFISHFLLNCTHMSTVYWFIYSSFLFITYDHQFGEYTKKVPIKNE